jgi:hypothetical protein
MSLLFLPSRQLLRWLLFLTLLLLAVACGQSSQTSEPTQIPVVETVVSQPTTQFTDNSFHIPLPNWPTVDSEDENTLIGVSQAGQGVTVARFATVPRIIGPFIADVLPQYGPFQNIVRHVEGSDLVWLEMTIASEIPQQAQMYFVYCDGFTYQITGSAPAAQFDAFLPQFEQILTDVRCDAQPETAVNEPGLVGLNINPPGDDYSFTNYREAAVTAREAGVQASHFVFSWADVETTPGEYDWTIPDLLLDTLSLEGIRLSLSLSFIHTSLPGPRPDDLEELPFDDPILIERAVTFVTAVVQRYGDQIDYLAFGNEVNIYLAEHPEAVEPFLTLFAALETAVANTAPNLPTGTTLAFHTAVRQNRLDLIELFRENDFLAYTYYPFGDGFSYDGDPAVFASAFEQMTAVSGDTPFLIVENGWATSPTLQSDEAKQAAYLQATFQTLAAQRSRFMRHIWYNLHDGQADICTEAALSFVEPGLDITQFGEAWSQFEAYLCTLGLRQSDGTPKLGWITFEVEMEQYLGFSGEASHSDIND